MNSSQNFKFDNYIYEDEIQEKGLEMTANFERAQ